jgi:predicted MFS family arabinose efflux permease
MSDNLRGEPAPSAPSPFGAFRHLNYQLYWSGQLLSLFGTWMQSVAQAWLVLRLSNSAWQVGAVTALQFTPVTLLGLVGGVVSDRVNKRRALLVTNSCAALQALALGLLTISGHVTIAHVMVMAALLGFVNAFDMPIRQSFVMEMVGRADLMNAISFNSTAFNAARIVGPALGGLLIARIDVGPLFLLNAASFLAVLASLFGIRESKLFAGPSVPRGSLVAGLRAGLDVVRRDPPMRTAVLLVAGVGTFGFNLGVILPVMARDVLRIGSSGFGLLMASAGVGSVTAGLALATRPQRNPARTMLLGAAGVAVLGLGFALSPRLGFLPLSVALLFGMGFSMISVTATVNNLMQQRAPGDLRGRVLSVYLTAFAASVPLGGLFAGGLARWKGAPFSAGCGAVLSGLVTWWAVSELRRTRAAWRTGAVE